MTLNPTGSTPLYIQIKELLQRQIEAGVFAVGQRLPSERELAEAHGVSRMTARHALLLLQQSGFTTTRVGKGTYVDRPQINQDLRDLTSFTQEMGGRGFQPTSRVLRAEVLPAAAEIAVQLGLSIGDEIVLLQRVRLADDKPVALETAHLRHSLCPRILAEHDFASESLYRVLTECYDVRPVWATQLIGARMPTRFEQEALGLGPRVPVLSLARLTFDQHDQPVEYVRSCYHSERYQLRTVLRDVG